jgi:hypothetical protein
MDPEETEASDDYAGLSQQQFNRPTTNLPSHSVHPLSIFIFIPLFFLFSGLSTYHLSLPLFLFLLFIRLLLIHFFLLHVHFFYTVTITTATATC